MAPFSVFVEVVERLKVSLVLTLSPIMTSIFGDEQVIVPVVCELEPDALEWYGMEL